MSRSSPILLAMWTAVLGLQVNAQSTIDRSRDRFPVYDPSFEARQIEAAEVPASHANRPRLRSIPPPKPKPKTATTDAPFESTETEPDSEVVKLPEMTVETQALPTAPLPRLVAPAPKKDVTFDPFIPKALQTERLVEKHLSVFDRLFLNRFDIFGSNKKRASEAEAREEFAHVMNSIAEGIEQADAWGLTDEEKKQLKKEYLERLNARPQ